MTKSTCELPGEFVILKVTYGIGVCRGFYIYMDSLAEAFLPTPKQYAGGYGLPLLDQ